MNPDLEWLAQLSVEEFREMFRGSPVKRAKLSGLRRNVVIAMANSGDERFLPILQQLCHRRRRDGCRARALGRGTSAGSSLQHLSQNNGICNLQEQQLRLLHRLARTR